MRASALRMASIRDNGGAPGGPARPPDRGGGKTNLKQPQGLAIIAGKGMRLRGRQAGLSPRRGRSAVSIFTALPLPEPASIILSDTGGTAPREPTPPESRSPSRREVQR